MLSQLAEERVFSKLDANSGFWQVRLDPNSKLLTTFITPWGRYCFHRMPFGISSAPEFYQRAMEKILDGLDGVLCFMDGVFSVWQRRQGTLEPDSRKFSNASFRQESPSKCEFGSESVRFLGHVISSEGIRPRPQRRSKLLVR